MNAEKENLITQAEAARFAGITPARINQILKTGNLKSHLKYGKVFVDKNELMNYLNEEKDKGGRPKKKNVGEYAQLKEHWKKAFEYQEERNFLLHLSSLSERKESQKLEYVEIEIILRDENTGKSNNLRADITNSEKISTERDREEFAMLFTILWQFAFGINSVNTDIENLIRYLRKTKHKTVGRPPKLKKAVIEKWENGKDTAEAINKKLGRKTSGLAMVKAILKQENEKGKLIRPYLEDKKARKTPTKQRIILIKK